MWSYLELLADVIKNGEQHNDRTGVGTRSVFGRQLRISMRGGFPLLTTKRMPFRWVVEELLWFLSGSTNEADLRAKGVDIWKEWATAEQCAKFGRQEGDLGPVYGKLWTDFRGVDQIDKLLHQIRTQPNSRRLIVTGWDPEYCEQVALPPCHTLWQVKVHHDQSMSLHLYARSIDIFLGLPFNIASYALLLSMIGHVTGYVPRDLIISFGDLHLYNNHLSVAQEQIFRTPYKLPTLHLDASVTSIFDFTAEKIMLIDYVSHPKLAAEVAV
jgi:thymidylate synthase